MAKILIILLCIALLVIVFGYDDSMRVIFDRFMAVF